MLSIIICMSLPYLALRGETVLDYNQAALLHCHSATSTMSHASVLLSVRTMPCRPSNAATVKLRPTTRVTAMWCTPHGAPLRRASHKYLLQLNLTLFEVFSGINDLRSK